MHLPFRLTLATGTLCVAACHRMPDADGIAPAANASTTPSATVAPPGAGPEAAAPSASVAAGSAGDDAIADRYACDAGTTLLREDDGSFRAEIPRNAPTRLARIAGSEPPVFTGASLYLRIESGSSAILSQGDRTNELRCTAAQAPA